MSPDELERAKQQSWQIIDRLPQRAIVPAERIAKWIDAMAAREPERLVWHALRQSGFSGSEVGTLVENRRSRRAHFGSARKLVMQKLFMVTPDNPNEHMLRGIETEDMHRGKFLKLWNATRDTAAFDALSAARGRYPFLRYSPDDVVIIQGARVLVDYKSPGTVEDEEEYSFDYQCQINLGADILNIIGMPADHGMLSRLSWKDWRCVGTWVEIDPHLQQEIADCAHHYWSEHVLKADPPPFVTGEKLTELPEQVKHDLKLLSAQITAIDEVTAKLLGERELLNLAIKDVAKKSSVVGTTTVFAHNIKTVPEVDATMLSDALATFELNVEQEINALSVVTKFDNDQLVGHLKTIDFDLGPFVVKKELAMDKVLARMDELGISPEHVLTYHYDVRKTTKKDPEVIAFKPQFASEGEAVKSRVTSAALVGVGERKAIALDEDAEVLLVCDEDYIEPQALIG
jgi:hypothetical protein